MTTEWFDSFDEPCEAVLVTESNFKEVANWVRESKRTTLARLIVQYNDRTKWFRVNGHLSFPQKVHHFYVIKEYIRNFFILDVATFEEYFHRKEE